MTIGIIGANGFIGKELIKVLLEETKYGIKTFTRKQYYISDKRVVSFIGNICYDDINFIRFMKSVDILIHLGENFTEDLDYLLSVQLKNNKIISDYIFTYNIKKIIYFSSIAVYGEGMNKKESDILLPITNYGFIKRLSEFTFMNLLDKGKDVIIFRPSNIYGINSKKGVIYHFIKGIKNKKELIIYGNGNQVRDFLHIDDCVKIIIQSLDYNKSGIFNLSSGKGYSLNDIITILKNNFKLEFNIIYLPINKNNPIKILSEDISKLEKYFNCDKNVTIIEGLKKEFGNQYM